MKIDDDILKQELGNSGDVQLKNIVRTIQKEQNAIIRNTRDRILVIQGAAGSGKTSIALHRIAYLLYHDRKRLRSSNVLILSPNSVFSDYISHVLPELGEEHILEMSFDLFAYRELQDLAPDCQDRFDAVEEQMRMGERKDSRWKQSEEFVRAAEGFLLELEDRLMNFKNVEYRGFSRNADEILHLFYYKFPDIPLMSRMDAVMEYFVDEYETLSRRTIPEEDLETLREKFYRMYVSRDVYQIYNWFLEDRGMKCLSDVPKEQRFLEYEDVYPLLYLKYRLFTVKSRKQIRHLVIDEMQDYTFLQYVLLRRMFECSMTILGDRAQTVDDTPRDVLNFLPKIFGKDIRRIEIKKSYRNTMEIACYAEKISGVSDVQYLERHGKEVEEKSFASLDQTMEQIAKIVKAEAGRFETAAVLVMTEKEAVCCYDHLKECSLPTALTYLNRDSTSFQRGLTVTTFYQAKGLEFDQVFLVGGEPEHRFFRQFLYIGATRALHELYVFQYGKGNSSSDEKVPEE